MGNDGHETFVALKVSLEVHTIISHTFAMLKGHWIETTSRQSDAFEMRFERKTRRSTTSSEEKCRQQNAEEEDKNNKILTFVKQLGKSQATRR